MTPFSAMNFRCFCNILPPNFLGRKLGAFGEKLGKWRHYAIFEKRYKNFPLVNISKRYVYVKKNGVITPTMEDSPPCLRKQLTSTIRTDKAIRDLISQMRGMSYPMFLMNRDGFSLLAMGFTVKNIWWQNFQPPKFHVLNPFVDVSRRFEHVPKNRFISCLMKQVANCLQILRDKPDPTRIRGKNFVAEFSAAKLGEKKMIKILIEGEPTPAARHRFNGRVCYQPARNMKYREEIQYAAREAVKKAAPLTGAISATVKLYRKYKVTSRQYGDVDNHLKAIFDGLQGICFSDDAQIVRCEVEKNQDKKNPRAEICLSEV